MPDTLQQALCRHCSREMTRAQVRSNGYQCKSCRATGKYTPRAPRAPRFRMTAPAGKVFAVGAAVRLKVQPPLAGVIERPDPKGGWWVRTIYGVDWFADQDVRDA